MNSNFYSDLKDDREDVSSHLQEKIDFIIRETGSGKKVLDVACNDGYIGEILLNKNNDIYGIDVVKSKLLIAQKRGLKVEVCDVGKEQFPYPDNYFDIVILGDIIEHVFNTDEILRKCKKVLKKGGKLIIITPNVASLGRRVMLLFGINPFIEYSLELPPVEGFPAVGHIRYYTSKTLRLQLLHNGFKSIEIQGGALGSVFFKLMYGFRRFSSFFPHLMCVAKK